MKITVFPQLVYFLALLITTILVDSVKAQNPAENSDGVRQTAFSQHFALLTDSQLIGVAKDAGVTVKQISDIDELVGRQVAKNPELFEAVVPALKLALKKRLLEAHPQLSEILNHPMVIAALESSAEMELAAKLDHKERVENLNQRLAKTAMEVEDYRKSLHASLLAQSSERIEYIRKKKTTPKSE